MCSDVSINWQSLNALLGPPCSLRHNNIEIRPTNNPTMASKCSSERKNQCGKLHCCLIFFKLPWPSQSLATTPVISQQPSILTADQTLHQQKGCNSLKPQMMVGTFLAIKYFLVKVHTSLFYCSFNRLQYGINFYMCCETENVWLALLWWSRIQLQYLWGMPANAGNKRHSKHERPASSQVVQWWRICLPMQDLDLIPGLARYLGVRNGNPLQYSCLENPTYRGAWRATVLGVAKSQTQLSDWTHTYTHASLRNTSIPILLHLPSAWGKWFLYLVQALKPTSEQ